MWELSFLRHLAPRGRCGPRRGLTLVPRLPLSWARQSPIRCNQSHLGACEMQIPSHTLARVHTRTHTRAHTHMHTHARTPQQGCAQLQEPGSLTQARVLFSLMSGHPTRPAQGQAVAPGTGTSSWSCPNLRSLSLAATMAAAPLGADSASGRKEGKGQRPFFQGHFILCSASPSPGTSAHTQGAADS